MENKPTCATASISSARTGCRTAPSETSTRRRKPMIRLVPTPLLRNLTRRKNDDMTKTIEEAANKYADNAYYPAPDYGWYESDDEQMKEVLADTFKTGADYLVSLPLASRLTAEEKERVRKEYANTYPNDIDCGVENMLIQGVLERIFGKEFFKEEE